ncbi:tRNA preQ1(34) S-adenosylmethionine ribosyltransferase-isomerase QueA [Synechococcus sp. R60.4]|uniref:tRNA preQ1(34) S-adenosylmethionine ribosyltransferase-isomerase QueA n=1 Tax=unclassified Synechococcus TaxID=2626047 RepID=UPI0039C3D200
MSHSFLLAASAGQAEPGQLLPGSVGELNPDLLTASYDYSLPPERIAQAPVEPRDQARMLVVYPDRHEHRRFCDLPDYLQAGDLLVLNDTKVIPARLWGAKVLPGKDASGARVEVLLLEPIPANTSKQEQIWRVLVRPGKRVKVGDQIRFWDRQGSPAELGATVLAVDAETGGRVVQLTWEGADTFEQILGRVGRIPLPPYLKAAHALDPTSAGVRPEDYQTVWARHPGSVAAPTAGLHFTPQLLERLAQKGIQTAYITLNIGLGTFRPVEAERVTDHRLHSEWLKVPAETVDTIRETQAQGRRVIAVGTTVVRALETAALSGTLQPWQGKSDLFIYPGYSWRVVQGLITNFHLPRSSLMMLVAALIGRERLLDLYQEAIREGYRFYSFGDGMLILP